MIENITVNDKNGYGIFAEGLAYVQFLSSGKKYILYTMNEPSQNDTIKMYVGELTDTVGLLDKIPDEEWKNLRNPLNKLAHGEKNPDIQFLSMNNATFNIGIPKKLAITRENKQAFKDLQRAAMLENQQQQMNDEPAVVASTNGGFYNQEEVNGTPAFDQTANVSQEQVNIFNNPMKPEVVPMQTSGGVVNQESVQGTEPQGGMQMVDGMMNQGQAIGNGQVVQNAMGQGMAVSPAPDTQMIQQAGVMTPGMNTIPGVDMSQNMNQGQPNNPIPQGTIGAQPADDNAFISNPVPLGGTASDVANALENASIIDTGDNIQFQQGLATNLSNDLGVATGITPKDINKEVTKEEALEALEVLNRYFKNTKELPSELANELNSQNSDIVKEKNEEDHPMIAPSSDEVAVANSVPQPTPLPPSEMIYSDNMGMSGASMNDGMVQEQAKTLSLVPDNMPGVIPATTDTNLIPEQPVMLDTGYQAMSMDGMMPSSEANVAQQAQTGYVASSNGPAVSMTSAPTNINEVPVTLPDNYNPQAVSGNVMMGPGSLPTETVLKAA